MIDLECVLVATDFGAASAAALKHGIELARQSHARLFLLHVAEHPGEAVVASDGGAMHNRLRQLLTRDEARALRPRYAVRYGAPADEIVEFARDRHIDLIVMGTHGRDGIVRAVMGSVAEKVVRRASCPVLTVHQPDPPRDAIGVPVAVEVAAAGMRLELT